jgi:APA family basic amino acid/polyamine antiporter
LIQENNSVANKMPRQLGLAAAMAIVTGESVALGIFLTPASMAKSLGSPLLLLAVWIGMAVMAMCGALCYSELAVRFPESGGEYVYLRAGYGDRIAFLYGWMSTVVMYPGVAASLAVGSAAYVAALAPQSPWLVKAFPALLLIVFGAVNLLGTAFSGRLVSIVNVLKFVLLFSLVGWAVFSGKAHASNLTPFAIRAPGSDPIFGAVVGAIVSAFFSFGGWWEAGKIAGEVRDPKRNLPLAFVGGVALVIAIYLLISFTFIAVIPLGQLTSSTAFVALFGGALFGSAGAKVLSWCVLLCVFGGMSALMMAAPRVCFAMAKSGSFFAPFARLSRRFQTPVNAILLHTGLALLVLSFGAFDRMLAYIIFAAVFFLGLAASTLFRLPQPVVAWWYPAAPVFFIACCAILSLLIMMHDPLPALIGTVVVLCGDPAGRWIERQRTLTPSPLLERN